MNDSTMSGWAVRPELQVERREWAADVADRMRRSQYQIVRLMTDRRQFLRYLGLGAGVAAGSSLLAACGGDTPAPATSTAGTSGPATGGATGGGATSGGTGTIPNGAGRELTVSVWGGETQEAFTKTVVPVFTELTGATVTFDVGGGGDRFNKLLAQKASPSVDVFINSGENVFQANSQGLLQDFDSALVPNLAKIADFAKLFPYGVSYGLITFGLASSAKLGQPLQSWEQLWTPDLAGKLAVPAIGHTQMPMFLIMMAELNGGSAENIDPALKKLAELDPAVLSVFWTNWGQQAQSGEVLGATEFDYSVLGMNAAGIDVKYTLPEEKAIGADNTMAIVKGRPNADLANVFVNVTLDADVQTKFCEIWRGAPANVDATIGSAIAGKVKPAAEIIDQVKFFDLGMIAGKRAEWSERLNQEVLPQWQ